MDASPFYADRERPERPKITDYMKDWRMYANGARRDQISVPLNRAQRRSLLKPVIRGKESANQLQAIAILKNEELHR